MLLLIYFRQQLKYIMGTTDLEAEVWKISPAVSNNLLKMRPASSSPCSSPYVFPFWCWLYLVQLSKLAETNLGGSELGVLLEVHGRAGAGMAEGCCCCSNKLLPELSWALVCHHPELLSPGVCLLLSLCQVSKCHVLIMPLVLILLCIACRSFQRKQPCLCVINREVDCNWFYFFFSTSSIRDEQSSVAFSIPWSRSAPSRPPPCSQTTPEHPASITADSGSVSAQAAPYSWTQLGSHAGDIN